MPQPRTGFFKTRFRRLVALILLVVACLSVAMWLRVRWAAHQRVYANAAEVPATQPPLPIALVLGAGVWADNTPSPVLYDRLATAVELYKLKRVSKLLMTGDNSYQDYNEPEVMRQTALAMGVPDTDIVLDFAGRRTYDSCYRAREIFGVTQAVIVTQNFHLPRTLYLCRELGIDSVGVVADRRVYERGSRLRWAVRENLAQVGAWWDINLLQPTPILGEKIPIK